LGWSLSFTKSALASLKKLDRQTASRILEYLETRVASQENPRLLGKALVGEKYQDIWRYRVGDYRILVEIKQGTLTILVVEIGHHREIYR